MTQAEVLALVDPYRWTDNELLVACMCLLVIGLLDLNALLVILLVAVVAYGVWFFAHHL